MNFYNNYTYLKDKPKCPKCGKSMELDDIEYRFKGNQDEYWICDEECSMSAFVRVRFNKPIDIEYNNEHAERIKYEKL